MSTRTISLIVVVILLVALFYPVRLEVAPPWTIQVVDQDGRAVAGCEVRESWTWSFLEHQLHQADLTTDAAGMAAFPARAIQPSIFRRIVGHLSARFSSHAGPYVPVIYATACAHQPGFNMAGPVDYKSEAAPTRVTVRR